MERLQMNETELIELLKKSDEEAFRMVFEQNNKFVLNTCYKFVKDRSAAEDLTQDVFIEVFKSIINFNGNSKLSTWIYRISVSKSIDYLRKMKRKKRFHLRNETIEVEEVYNNCNGSTHEHPAFKVENEDRIRVLNTALDSIPDNQRVAFTLSKCDELSYKEIAEIMETTVSSVESLIHRAKKNLEKKLYKFYKNNL